MNIDKFGHYIHKRMRLSELFECYDNALTKTENGEFDLKATTLRGIRTPVEPDDAVNKDYVDQFMTNITKDLYNSMLLMRTQIMNDVQNTLKAKISEVSIHLEDKFYTKTVVDNLLASKRPS